MTKLGYFFIFLFLVLTLASCRKSTLGSGKLENNSKSAKTDKEEKPDKESKKPKASTDKGEKSMNSRIKDAFKPQVAGSFYTANPTELKSQVLGFLENAEKNIAEINDEIVGVITPHAGYEYSGRVAGYSYAALSKGSFTTVFVLALSHRHSALKAAILKNPAYDTPLGSVEIDKELVRQLIADHPQLFEYNEKVFAGEHSLEVQLPFIQVAMPKVKIVPVILAVHNLEFLEKVANVLLETAKNNNKIAFAVSSDLSHFYNYDEAVRYDNSNLDLLLSMEIEKWLETAPSRAGMCGYLPVFTFMKMFEKFDEHKRKVIRLAYENSGDVTGDHSRVVGYGALAFTVKEGIRKEAKKNFGEFDINKRRALMSLAKAAVKKAVLGKDIPDIPDIPLLKEKGAAFVTLTSKGHLRGCIGHVIAQIPLYKCIIQVAGSAAIHDTRFSPVRPDELDELHFEISVLTEPVPIKAENVVVGRHGLVMERGGRSGLLLPQVPVDWGWGREEFLSHTCQKAGLPPNCWKEPDTKISGFEAIVWSEDDI